MLLTTTTASAQECDSDADCADGQVCEVVAIGGCACPPCMEGEECPPCECDETTYSECITPPITCDADSDCPEGLTCLSGGVGEVPCTITEDGEEDCPDVEPQEWPGYCEFVPSECEADSDCAEGFICEMNDYGGAPCVGMCDEDGNCEEWCDEPEPSSGGYCIPQQIECAADSDCPSEWSCHTFTSEACSGGGSVGSGCACPDCAPGEECPPCDCEDEPTEPTEPEDVMCEEYTENYCLPAGWDDWVDSNQGGGGSTVGGSAGEESSDRTASDIFGGGNGAPGENQGGSSTDDGNASGDEEAGGGGCSVSDTSAPVGNTGLLTVLLGLTALIWRRRA